MSAAAPKSSAKSSEETLDEENPTKPQGTRETIESIIVAFILAFLFRAFVAEAFVIPTGSMAPTLMGAHKDLFCQHCGRQYQASASSEFNSATGSEPLCHGG
ncbi:MAG: S26 family signal peptidase [Pirellulaceae bacterium]